MLARAFLLLGVCVSVTTVSAESPPWTGSCKSSDTADDKLANVDLNGKVFVYTGADGNIAKEANIALAKRGATLVLACRSQPKCDAVKTSVEDATGSKGKVFVESLDLSSIQNVRDFAARIKAAYPKGIHALINSAGLYSTFETKDGFVAAMQVNLLAPALLTQLLLPVLKGGRVVNVAAATYGMELQTNVSVSTLASWSKTLDPKLNATGSYFQLSKYLMTHHAIELAAREPDVTAIAVNPGVAFLSYSIPNWVVRFPLPDWLWNALPYPVGHIHTVCMTNLKGVEHCPETFSNSAAVVTAAAAWPDIEAHSGSYLDFDSSPLPPGAKQVYGPWTQKDPTCVPRTPPPMDAKLRSEWYDEMLKLMGGVGDATETKADSPPAVKV